MTDKEMIEWAKFPFVVGSMSEIASREALKRLVWIAKLEGQRSAWARMRDLATMEHDAAALSSYPVGFHNNEDYMAALGPCGK